MAVADDDARDELFNRLMSSGMSVRQCEGAATYFKEHGELPKVKLLPSLNQKEARTRNPKRLMKTLSASRGRLESALETKISFSGSPKKGKMTISYA